MGDSAALEHELLRELAIERFGVELSPRRSATIAKRLRGRLRAHALTSVAEYYRLLRGCPDGLEEWGLFADAVTNHETFLFRGGGQLEDLIGLLPELGDRRGPLRVLSAGCASGEEAYSIAAVLAAHARHLRDGFEVVGVDISTPRLADACVGRYDVEQQRGRAEAPPGVSLDAWFARDDGCWVPRAQTRRFVTFQRGNLAAHGGLGLGRFPVVFCRNVLIYAHPDAWPRFLRTLERCLEPGGYLFLGESESLLDRAEHFSLRRLRSHFAYVLTPCPSAS